MRERRVDLGVSLRVGDDLEAPGLALHADFEPTFGRQRIRQGIAALDVPPTVLRRQVAVLGDHGRARPGPHAAVGIASEERLGVRVRGHGAKCSRAREGYTLASGMSPTNKVLITDHTWPDVQVEVAILEAAGLEVIDAPSPDEVTLTLAGD